MTDDPRNGRDTAALHRHYLVERELADRLRSADPAERKGLYRTVYDELFRRVIDHPQHSRKIDPARHEARTAQQFHLLRRHLGSEKVFIEVGAGDCHLTMAIAAEVDHAYGVDVSDVIADAAARSGQFTRLQSDGTGIPLADGVVDVAYSHMLIEHLHPDDAAEHVREVYRVLGPGGVYVCETPHKYSGPHDISRYFDSVATGFHLKEYTFREMRAVFRAAGFRATRLRIWVRGRTYPFPRLLAHGLERLLGLLPARARHRVATSRLLRRAFVAVVVEGRKVVGVRKPVTEPVAAGVAG